MFLILAIAVPMATCFSIDASCEVSMELNKYYTDSTGFGHVCGSYSFTNNTQVVLL